MFQIAILVQRVRIRLGCSTASEVAIMINLDPDLSQWYIYNQDGLDFWTPDPPEFGSRGTSPAPASQPQTGRQRLPLLQLAD